MLMVASREALTLLRHSHSVPKLSSSEDLYSGKYCARTSHLFYYIVVFTYFGLRKFAIVNFILPCSAFNLKTTSLNVVCATLNSVSLVYCHTH